MISVVPAKFYFGSPIENKPKLPDGFRFIESEREFLLATDGVDTYYVTKDELILKDAKTGRLDERFTIKLSNP